MRSVLAVALLLLIASPVGAAEPKTSRDVPYAETKNERQTLDIYAPATGKDHPVIFWIHGGGWQHGDKAEADKKPQAFVDKGFVFVSTNYRLFPEASVKQMAGDVAKAIHWVRDHAKDFGGDPNTLIVTGHSAGAQLAALVCTDERFLAAEGMSLAMIKGCIPVDGDTYDVPLQIATVEKRRADSYLRTFGDMATQKDWSPITHVAKGKNIPPFLIIYVADHPETKAQSERMVKALQEAGVSAKTYPAEGTDHVKLNADMGPPDDKPTQAFWAFVDGILKR